MDINEERKMGSSFPNLLTPGKIGSLNVRNRMVMPPMGTNYGSDDGFVTQRTIDYYEARAAGGTGLIIVEFCCVEAPRGKGTPRQICIDDDKYLPQLRELASTIKRRGAAAFLQIHHAGREAHIYGLGMPTISPSALRSLNPKIPAPTAFTYEEIQTLIGQFVAGAERAKRAGFDGIELHGAHTYLLSQFLSPICNVRTDEYGGSLENRARVVVEIVTAIRQRLGRDYPVAVRLSAEEFMPNGITIEETCEVARMLEAAGADMIDVSAGGASCPKPLTTAPAFVPRGHLLPYAAQVKQAVRIPVMGVGRLNTPDAAESGIRNGQCDFVGIGRGLIADPEFANKVASGREREIRPCTACLHCLSGVVLEDAPMVCGNNPTAGRERESVLQPASPSKKVFVVGGGVAGMEAARIAAARGHEVTLFERDDRLGGQLITAALPPHKSELTLMQDYYEATIAAGGIQTRLGQAVDAETILAGRPDVVIVATGSRPEKPVMPGIDGGNVVQADDVLTGKATTGQRVVVIGGELVGCETAEFLAVQGKQVTIVRRGAKMATGIGPIIRRQLLERLATLKVATVTRAQYDGIDARGVTITTAEGNQVLLEADTVVLAAGSAPVNELAAALEGKVPVVHVIGDALKPRRFLEAIQEGAAAGMAV